MTTRISWSVWPSSPTPRRRRSLDPQATAQTTLIQSSLFRVRSALAGNSRTGGRVQTARHQAGREPDGFVRSEHQARHSSVDDRKRCPASVPAIDLGLIGVMPANKERLLSVTVLEIAVVGIRVVAVDLRRFFTADVMIRDRKQWRPA